jgi:hypothetical protein
MKQAAIHSLAAAAIGALLAFPSVPAFAKTVAACNAEYAASKAANSDAIRPPIPI